MKCDLTKTKIAKGRVPARERELTVRKDLLELDLGCCFDIKLEQDQRRSWRKTRQEIEKRNKGKDIGQKLGTIAKEREAEYERKKGRMKRSLVVETVPCFMNFLRKHV